MEDKYKDKSLNTFQEYVDARYNLRTLSSSDMKIFTEKMMNDKSFFQQIVEEFERCREDAIVKITSEKRK